MAMSPHFLDELFADETDAAALTAKITKHPRFLEALAKGLGAEAESKQFRQDNPGSTGAGDGQKGRTTFLRSLEQVNVDYDKAVEVDAA